MFKKLKMKIAARRVNNKKSRRGGKANATKTAVAIKSFFARTWNIICVPFRAIGRGANKLWAWIRNINVIGLVNATLLSAIIVLFSILIIDIIGCRRQPVVLVARNELAHVNQTQINVSQTNIQRTVRPRETATLPLQKDSYTRKFISDPINVANVRTDTVAVRQTARRGNTMYGDIIVDSRGAATMLHPGDTIHGNLYLQNMRKYTLPCDVRINGNLFLRDMGMLQFCGDFTVTGNIYVSPRSSFGPLPRTARIGGQVIL